MSSAQAPAGPETRPSASNLPAGGRRMRWTGGSIAVYIGGELANKLTRFIAAVILARALSVSDYGLVNVGIAVSGVAVMITTVGLSELGAREVAVSPSRAGWLAGRVLAVRVMGVLTIGLLLVLAAILGNRSLVPLVVVVGLMSLATASSGEWLLRGGERLGMLGIADLLGGLTVTAGCALLAVTGATSVLAVGVWGVGEAVTAGVCWVASGRSYAPKVGITGVRELLRRSWPIGLSSLAFYTYYANIDTIILAATRSEREAGLYTAAYRLFLAANIVGIAAAYAQLPILSRAVEAGDDRQAVASLRRTLHLLACYGSVVVGAAELGGHMILSTLYGARFASMAPVLTVLCMGIAWYAVGFPAGYTLIARGKNKSFLAGSAAAAVLNLGLNGILIPPIGPMGAAIATLASFIAACLVWMYAHAMLDRAGMRLITALSVVSLGGLIVLLLPGTRVPLGSLTILAGLVPLAGSWREIIGLRNLAKA